jgi:hypothetical protein
MITIIHGLEILKAVTDTNVSGGDAEQRRISFTKATELMTQADVKVLIDGMIYKRIEARLNEDHKTFFKSIYDIDFSTVNVSSILSTNQSVMWIAQSEAKSRRVLIITENTSAFDSIADDDIQTITPGAFLDKVEKAKALHKKGIFQSLSDALTAVFFCA